MELIMMSLAGSLLAMSLQFSELFFGIGRQLRNAGPKTPTVLGAETMIPGCYGEAGSAHPARGCFAQCGNPSSRSIA